MHEIQPSRKAGEEENREQPDPTGEGSTKTIELTVHITLDRTEYWVLELLNMTESTYTGKELKLSQSAVVA